jgi:RNase P subunit RPR2
MNKSDLLVKWKEMGIKGVSSKTKNEILLLMEEHDQKKEQLNSNINENKLTNVMKELKIKIPKDKQRKVCKNCNELGHGITSIFCKINIDKNNKLKQKIKNYILSQDCLEDKNIEDYCVELSVLLDITPNLCKSLYNEIPLNELLNRQMNIHKYLTNINHLSKKCNECKKNIVCIQTNTHRIWKGNDICDTCWSKYEDYRKSIWEKIKAYKTIQCEICGSIQKHISERYHYDHLNMFNKGNSICSMVNECVNIEEIYSEIDKCQILCLSCHHIVTDIEHKLGFTRIKQTLTRELNQSELTEEEYNKQTQYYQNIYEEKIKFIYKELKLLGI